MYQQVQDYYKAIDEARSTYRRQLENKREATHRELEAEPRDADKRSAIRQRFQEATAALEATRGQACADALKELTNTIAETGDTFAAWLVGSEAFQEYPDHSRMVLEILPATQEQIRELGRENGWCNVLDDYLRQARNAGAFGPVDQAVVASEEMHAWFTRDFSSHQGHHVRLDGFVNRIVEAEVAKALADAAEARGQEAKRSE